MPAPDSDRFNPQVLPAAWCAFCITSRVRRGAPAFFSGNPRDFIFTHSDPFLSLKVNDPEQDMPIDILALIVLNNYRGEKFCA